MIQLHNISLSFGGQQVLERLTWTVRPGQRIGLIGPNGAGKSTLLRLIDGRQVPDEGTVSISGGTTIGYLEQDVQEVPVGRTVLEEALQAFEPVLKLEAEIDRITAALEEEDDHETEHYHRLLHDLADVQARLVAFESHRIRSQTEAVLSGLGFEADEMGRPLETFSGGWRMRVALARLLLRRPSYLLLDEPTNHLDIESIDWLEGYLRDYPGTVVIVSHDRYFLDRMVTTIVELSRGRATEYAGNYAFYLQEREERRMLQQAAYENQQREIEQTERFIERFRYKASKASQVQSRVKMLDKLERVPPPATEQAHIHFRFPEPRPSGRVVMELSEFSKTYKTEEGVVRVFDRATPLIIERGHKIALIGKNGAGKSTLARILNGSESFDGSMSLGYHVERTFFAQHQAESLNPEHTVLSSMKEVAYGKGETEIRSLLGAFLFTGDDAFKPVRVLSGGEKSRLALARTLLTPANFLILDEPTNHLDIQSTAILIEALRQFKGTFVIVSHDRHFLDQVVNHVWHVGGGRVRTFIGTYSEYQWQLQHGTASRVAEAEAVRADRPAAAAPAERAGGPKTKEQKRREAEARNRLFRSSQGDDDVSGDELSPFQLRRLYEKIEADILKMETEQEAVEARLADTSTYEDPAAMREAMTAYQAVKAELASLYEKWEHLATQLENAETS